MLVLQDVSPGTLFFPERNFPLLLLWIEDALTSSFPVSRPASGPSVNWSSTS